MMQHWNRLAEQPLDLAQVVALLLAAEGNGLAARPRPAGSADAVNVRTLLCEARYAGRSRVGLVEDKDLHLVQGQQPLVQ